MKNIVISFCLFAVHQSFLIDRAGRKKLMGYGYLLMGITMCVLTVMLSIKVNTFSTFPLLLLYVRGFIPSIQLLQDLNSWIPYVNITLIFCVICIYELGPCELFLFFFFFTQLLYKRFLRPYLTELHI